jgi:hypothetical protein
MDWGVERLGEKEPTNIAPQYGLTRTDGFQGR